MATIPRFLLVFLLACAVILFSGCEEEAAAPPPAPAPAPGRGRAPKAKPGKEAKDGPFNKGKVALDETAPVREQEVETPPEPSAESVWGFVYVTNPKKYEPVIKAASKSGFDTNTLSKLLAKAYGFETFYSVQWDQPMLLAWVEGGTVPMVVIKIEDKDEFLTPLPKDRILDQKGNDYSFPLNVTQTAYINFAGDYAIISSEWRHYPLAKDRLREILGGQHTNEFESHFELTRFKGLGQELIPKVPPVAMLAPDWENLGVFAEDTIDTFSECSFNANYQKDVVELDFVCKIKEDAPMRKAYGAVKTSPPKDLLKAVASVEPVSWIWQDTRQDQFKTKGVVAAGISHPLSKVKVVSDELKKSELELTQRVKGPSVWAKVGYGEEVTELFVVPLEDVAAYVKGVEKRPELMASMGYTRVESPKSFRRGTEPDHVWVYHTGEGKKPPALVEAIYGDTLYVAHSFNELNAAKIVHLLSQKSGKLKPPKWLADQQGTPLIIGRFDFADAKAKSSDPVEAALFVGEETIEIHAKLPKEQFKWLKLEL